MPCLNYDTLGASHAMFFKAMSRYVRWAQTFIKDLITNVLIAHLLKVGFTFLPCISQFMQRVELFREQIIHPTASPHRIKPFHVT